MKHGRYDMPERINLHITNIKIKIHNKCKYKYILYILIMKYGRYGMPERINSVVLISMAKALDFIDPDR